MKQREQILSHNHPGGTSFSTTDIEAACQYRLAEMRILTRDFTFSLTGDLSPVNLLAINRAFVAI